MNYSFKFLSFDKFLYYLIDFKFSFSLEKLATLLVLCRVPGVDDKVWEDECEVIGQQSLASHLQFLRHERQRRIRPAQVGARTVKDLDSTEIGIGIYIFV